MNGFWNDNNSLNKEIYSVNMWNILPINKEVFIQYALRVI